jgi:hypothetical protein
MILEQTNSSILFRLPQHFNYSKSIKLYGQIVKYRIRSQIPDEPYPMSSEDYQAGFYIMIQMVERYYKDKIDENHHETHIYKGARFLIHNPNDLFSKDSPSHQTVVSHSVMVHVNPQKTIIDKALEKYNANRFETVYASVLLIQFGCIFRRGCYLPNEKPLKFFKIYTKNNCRSECLANKTLVVCGCARFYMVRDVSTRVCGVNDMKCYKKVEEESQRQELCECYLECGEIEYKTEQQMNEFVK